MKLCNIIIYAFSFIFTYYYMSANASTAEESTYTAAEKKSLVKLRNLVKEQLYQDYMHRDEYLITWLRAKKLDVNQARGMLLGALEWRKENKIDSINEEEFPQFQGFKQYEGHTKFRDKVGRPVIFVLFGTWDIRKAVLAGETKNLNRYVIKMFYEEPSRLARQLGQANGSNSTQAVFIGDLTGYNLRQHGCVACLPFYVTLIQNLDKYYPQFYKESIGLNTPSIFNTVIQLIKPFSSDHFRKHLHVIGYDKNEISQLLTRFIPLDQIPVQYGGTNTRKIV